MCIATFDPASLNVPRLTRAAKRLGKDDATAMHNCRLRRKRTHGGCNLDGVGVTAAETTWGENNFGLGFEDEHGTLTHFLWMKAKGENGPYHVWLSRKKNEGHESLCDLCSSFLRSEWAQRDSNPHEVLPSGDFKSPASANSATGP